jgi:hypothetical protein
MLLRAFLSFASLFSLSATAQPRPHNLVPVPARPGPWDNDLVIATSKDGLVFEKATRFVERGGVPHVATDAKGRLIAVFQWFPFEKPEAFDKVGVRISEDNGKSWSEPKPIVVKNLPEGYARPFDPTLVLLEDGRLRLYFTSHRPDRRTPAIYSAVGADGVEYEFEPGARLAVEGEAVIDCACARLGKTFHLYSPIQDGPGRAYHAVSDDGLTFRRVEDVGIANDTERERRWLGCALSTADGIRFYGTGRGRVWSAVSKDGASWQVDEQTRAEGADPGVARAADGTYVLIGTGGRRADAGRVRPPR